MRVRPSAATRARAGDRECISVFLSVCSNAYVRTCVDASESTYMYCNYEHAGVRLQGGLAPNSSSTLTHTTTHSQVLRTTTYHNSYYVRTTSYYWTTTTYYYCYNTMLLLLPLHYYYYVLLLLLRTSSTRTYISMYDSAMLLPSLHELASPVCLAYARGKLERSHVKRSYRFRRVMPITRDHADGGGGGSGLMHYCAVPSNLFTPREGRMLN